MKEKGYLQVEILAVVMIIVVFTALGRYSPRIVQDVTLDCEARLLATEMRWLQQYAMNVAKGHSEFPDKKGEPFPSMYFRIGSPGGYSVLKENLTIRKHQFSHDVSLKGNYPSISFNSVGYVNAPVTIALYQGAKQKKIIMDRVGRIRVDD